MSATALKLADDEREYGGKAVGLGAALRADLPVPDGVALSVGLVDALNEGSPAAVAVVEDAAAQLGTSRLAVRSSAVGEDSDRASFAGQHVTRLNVPVGSATLEAIEAVWKSARTEAAFSYRRRLGIESPPRIAVVLQRMVDPECAGVLFTRDPRTGADRRIIEGAWGLGEAVVAGLVTPDHVVMERGGHVLEHVVGHKDIALRFAADGGVEQQTLPAKVADRSCLDHDRIARLEKLAAKCEAAFDAAHDIEWAFVHEDLFLLQRRAVTT